MLSVIDSGTLRALGAPPSSVTHLTRGWWWTGPGQAPSDALAVALLAPPMRPGPVVTTRDQLGRGTAPPLATRPAPGQPPLVLGGRLAAAGLGLTLIPDELPALLVSPPGSVAYRRSGLTGVRAGLEAAEVVLRPPVGVLALYRDGARQSLPWLAGTSAARTVQDAARYLDDLQLLWLVEQVLSTRTNPLDGASRRLARRLAALVGRADPRSRSPLETAVRLLLVDAGLPVPESNVRVLPGTVCDLVWADRRLIVECDGLAWHSGASVVSKDAARHRALQRAGWTVLRATWEDVRQRPTELVADVRAVLAR